MRLFLFALLMLPFSGCDAHVQRFARAEGERAGTAFYEPPQEVVDSAHEAALRHLFMNFVNEGRPAPAAFYVGVANNDPSPVFLRRFAKHAPPVLPASKFAGAAEPIFRIEKITWQSAAAAEAKASYSWGNLLNFFDLRLELRERRWTIVQRSRLAVSS